MSEEKSRYGPGEYGLGRALSEMAEEAGLTSAIDHRKVAMQLVNKERDRQEELWGQQNHTPDKWVGILGEEFGEFCAAVNETILDNGPDERARGGYENLMREASHVAAVAVSVMECLMRNRHRWGLH